MKTQTTLVIACAAALLVSACSKPPAPTDVAAGVVTPAADTAAAAPAAAAEAAAPKACDLVTAKEMSAILASPVTAKPNDGSNGKTECIYMYDKEITHTVPYAELTVEWGSGEDAMRVMGAMNHVEPGITDPYAGMGDQAATVGPALMIRKGNDLITIVLSGVEDVPATARRIYDTAKARL